MSNNDSTDTHNLLNAIGRGDQQALDELIRRHTPYLTRIVQLRFSDELKSRVDVSDVVQETTMTIMRRLDEFIKQKPSSFRVWIRSRAIEQIADQHRVHVRAKKRSVRREVNGGDRSSLAIARALVTETPSKRLRRAELAEQVRGLIDELNELDREILSLRHAEGLTNSESAEALGIPADTARKRYGRALRRVVEKSNASGIAQDLWGSSSWE